MNLLRKWAASVRVRLIDDWKRAGRFWSVRLAAIGALVATFVQWFPDTLSSIWNAMPADMRALLPEWLTHSVPIILFVAIGVSRIFAQKKAKTDG